MSSNAPEDEHERDLAIAEAQGAYSVRSLPKNELHRMVKEVERQMKAAAQALEFEKAAALRDQLVELRESLVLAEAGGDATPAWERLRNQDKNGVRYDVGG
jgi:excinuclease ABC subunit B